jgi:nucleotide-binding universal stress UspA family protein
MEKIKILIPTDFSVQAEYAYLMVKKISDKITTEITFLHVMNVPDTVTLSENGVVETCGDIDVNFVVSQKEIAERKLQHLIQIYGNEINIKVIFGKLTDSIIKFAEQYQFDLIAMGTKGSWGIKEKLSGSETQYVARKSRVPLLSLMCDRSDLVIKNILLVHDFSSPIKEDLSLLKKFISLFGAKLHQLHILKNQNHNDSILMLMDANAKDKGIDNYENHIIFDNDVENGVVHFNQMHEIDLVCIGTHQKAGMFHSSATEKLINHLFKPIISFHLTN